MICAFERLGDAQAFMVRYNSSVDANPPWHPNHCSRVTNDSGRRIEERADDTREHLQGERTGVEEREDAGEFDGPESEGWYGNIDGADALEEGYLFRAEPRNISGGQAGFFVVLMPPKTNEKLRVVSDSCEIEDLKEHFPTVSSSLLLSVWEQRQHAWGACFDVLSSLVHSHNLNNNDHQQQAQAQLHGQEEGGGRGVILTQCEFVFKDADWPSLSHSLRSALSSSYTAAPALSRPPLALNTLPAVSGLPVDPNSADAEEKSSDLCAESSFLGEDWSVISVDDIAAKLTATSLQATTGNFTQTEFSDNKTEDSWEVLSELSRACSQIEDGIPAKGPVSYRDILLRNSQPRPSKTAIPGRALDAQMSHKRKNPPVIVVSSTRIPRKRAGKLYMSDLTAVGDSSIACVGAERVGVALQTVPETDDESDEEGFLSSYYSSSEYIKGKASVTRMRAITRLPAPIAEKRLMRIKAKTGR